MNWWIEANRSGRVVVWALLPHPWGEEEWSADARLLEGESGRTVVSKSARGLGALQDASRGRMVEGAGSVAGLRMAAGLETGDTAGWETCGTGLAGTDFRRQ